MDCKPEVGMLVYLNDTGLERIFNTSHGLSSFKRTPFRISRVDPEPIARGVWPLDVEDDDINIFLLDSACFDFYNGTDSKVS